MQKLKNLFMYDTDEAMGQSESTENVDTETTEEQGKTYSQEEVDKLTKNLLTQEQVDEIVKKRLAREKEKAEEEKAEAERLSKLSEKQRQEEERKQKDEEIAKLKAEIKRKELEEDTTARLNEEGLSLNFKSFLMGEDAEVTNKNIIEFKKVWEETLETMVNDEINKRFPGRSVKASQTPQTVDVFSQISKRYKK